MFDYLSLQRYEEKDKLRNNTEFLRMWQSSLNRDKLMSKFIKETMTTIKGDLDFFKRKGMMKSSAAVVAAAEKQNKYSAKQIEKQIEEAITANMFKYKGFSNVLKYWINKIIKPVISQAKLEYNITDLAIAACKKKDCDKVREK